MPLLDAMQPWHDLYMLFGTASATLIGLLFVAASVSSGVFDQTKHAALRSFLSPTVVHFASVLVACLIAVCPLRSWHMLGLLIGGDGVFGLAYALAVLHRMIRHGLTARIDLEDRMWYAILPAVDYAIMAAAGLTFFLWSELGCDVLAVAMGLLLLAGLRNAWDITVWTVMQRPN